MKKFRVFMAATRDRATDLLRLRRARIVGRVLGGPDREDPVEAELEAQDADRVGHGVPAAEAVVDREQVAVGMAKVDGFWPLWLSSRVIRLRLFASSRALAAAPGVVDRGAA